MRYSCLGMLLLAACGGDPTTPDPSVLTVVVTPSESPPLRGGDSFQFSAQAQDADGNPLASPVTWSTDHPELASVSPSGLLTILTGTGQGSGSVSVIAASEGKQGQALAPIHDWSYEESGDPLTGGQVRVASLGAESGPTRLHVRCQASYGPSRAPPLQVSGSLGAPGRLEVYVTGEALTVGMARYRLDQQPERAETWFPGDTYKSVFYPFDTRSLAQAIVDADTLRFEYAEEGGGTVSSTFAVGGLEHYIDRLFADCLGVILKISGDAQSAFKGAELPEPLVVEVRGPDGNPAAGIDVLWMTGGHDGTVSSLYSTTDAEGHASVRWTIGSLPDVSHVTAIAVGMVTFSARGNKYDATTTIISHLPDPSTAGEEVTVDVLVRGTDGGIPQGGGDLRYNSSSDSEEHQVN